MEPAIFLDRDNTLIANDGDLGDPTAVRLLEGVPEGLRALREAGYRLVVVTNQGGVARGRFNEEDVDAVHQRIALLVDQATEMQRVIDRFYYCPYHPDASVEAYRRDHPWRKPNPGMIVQAARDMGLDLGRSWLIGDQPRDVAAGRAAGCRTILVTPNGDGAADPEPTAAAPTFGDAVETILDETPAELREEAAAARRERAAAGGDLGSMRRAILELAEEVRSDRVRRGEFTALKMAAGACQLLVLLLALLGLLQVNALETFVPWMLGAVLMQLVTITLILLDQRG